MDHQPIRCELIGWERFQMLARRLALTIRGAAYRPDLIVAIGRGGCLPARILSDYLDVFDLTEIKIEHYHALRKERLAKVRYPLTAAVAGRRVLLVDDVSDTGETFEVAVRHLHACGEPEQVRTAVLHHKTVSRFVPDYCAETVSEWRWITYPWAVLEDLRSFLRALDPPPTSVEAFAGALRARHGIEVPLQTLEDVLALPDG